jgi:hypothetical protein
MSDNDLTLKLKAAIAYSLIRAVKLSKKTIVLYLKQKGIIYLVLNTL